MKQYRLTKLGKRYVKVPGPNRESVLDHLYEFKVATLDELKAIDTDAPTKLREFVKAGFVEELGGY